jgi:hypothetical protein
VLSSREVLTFGGVAHPPVCSKASVNSVGFEVRKTVTIGTTILWDLTPCSLIELHRRFGGSCCLTV